MQDGMAVVVKQMVRTMLTEKDKLEVLFRPLKKSVCSSLPHLRTLSWQIS